MVSAPSRLERLPTLTDRRDAEILIFDGNCRFCIAQMRLLDRMDIRRRLAFVSLHDPEVATRWPDLTHDQLMEQMYLVDHSGHRHAGAAAFRYLSRVLPPLWPLAPLLHIPFSLPLWKFCYRVVARYRYRFGRVGECDEGSCSVHFD